jgi:hypothetical protein
VSFECPFSKLMSIKVQSLWELLQQYPREVVVYNAGEWRDSGHIIASGVVDKVFMASAMPLTACLCFL